MIDLAAYFDRIGYDGPSEASAQVLRDLHALHIASIVFEDIDVQLDRGIDIAPAAVDAKLIAARRGGYCYEQNGLFKRVLEALGFEVEGLLGRVKWMLPAEPARGRTHMALRVIIDGQAWLTDVLERMVRGEVRSTELASLLPWAWRQPGTAAAA